MTETDDGGSVRIPGRLRTLLRWVVLVYEFLCGVAAVLILPLNIVSQVRWPWLVGALALVAGWGIAHWLLEKDRRMWTKIEGVYPGLVVMVWILIAASGAEGDGAGVIRGAVAFLVLIGATFWYTTWKDKRRA